MSSILDALNKVEEDRNARDASDSDPDAPFAPETAAEALFNPPKKRRRSVRRSRFNGKALAYAAGGLIVIALIVGLSAGVASLVGRANPSTPAVAVAAKPADKAPVQAVGKETHTVPAPEANTSPAPPDAQVSQSAGKPQESVPVPPAEAQSKPAATMETKVPEPEPVKPVAESSVPPAPELAKAVAEAPVPPVLKPVKTVAEKPAPKPPAEPVKLAKAAPVPAEEPTTPLPTPEAIARVRAEVPESKPQAVVPMRGSPVSLAPGRAAEKRAPFLEDVNALPRLGQAERERLGLGEMRLNVLREASSSQPEGLAIINLKKVYVGEMIPGTNARLIAVQTRAIAIEIEGTGERFKVMN